MTGDATDVLARIKAVLPKRWFADETPVLDGLLNGLSSGFAVMYALLQVVRQQTRIATATGSFLDMVSTDLFGLGLPRRGGEPDNVFRARMIRELLRDRGTRSAVVSGLSDVTGRVPAIFEPARSGDTGAYGTGSLGYSAGGAYGSLSLPYQSMVTAFRATAAGNGSNGIDWGPVSDADIAQALERVRPAAMVTQLWISN